MEDKERLWIMNDTELSQEIKNTFFKGMSDEQIEDYHRAAREIELEDKKQLKNDMEFLEELKKIVTPEYFEKITYQLVESENTQNYRYVDKPIGDKQNEGDCFIWVNQHNGMSGDDCHGTVCMRIKDKKYLKWDYWM